MKQTISSAMVFAFVLATLLILPFHTKAQNPQFETVSDEIKSKFENKQKQIIQELTSLQGNEWAGEYWADESVIDGALFVWSPSNGFTVRRGNDSHRGVEKVNFGGVNFNGNSLILSPEYLENNKHTYTISNSFVPVKFLLAQKNWK